MFVRGANVRIYNNSTLQQPGTRIQYLEWNLGQGGWIIDIPVVLL